MQIEMKIKGLVIDPISKMPIVVLEDLKKERMLPIWIGVFEANAISLKMENIPTPRPMTHDLVKNLLERLQWRLRRVEVCDLREGTFFAKLILTHNGTEIAMDSRPSDALALALRFKAPRQKRTN